MTTTARRKRQHIGHASQLPHIALHSSTMITHVSSAKQMSRSLIVKHSLFIFYTLTFLLAHSCLLTFYRWQMVCFKLNWFQEMVHTIALSTYFVINWAIIQTIHNRTIIQWLRESAHRLWQSVTVSSSYNKINILTRNSLHAGGCSIGVELIQKIPKSWQQRQTVHKQLIIIIIIIIITTTTTKRIIMMMMMVYLV